MQIAQLSLFHFYVELFLERICGLAGSVWFKINCLIGLRFGAYEHALQLSVMEQTQYAWL